jgi:hypothetical protein
LHCGNGAGLRLRDGDELLRAAFVPSAQVKMVAHEVQKRRVPDEGPAAQKRVPVPAQRLLFDKLHPHRRILQRARVTFAVARRDDDGGFIDTRARNFLDNDTDGRLLRPIRIDEGLQRQPILIPPRGGYDRFRDFHLEEQVATAAKTQSISDDRPDD